MVEFYYFGRSFNLSVSMVTVDYFHAVVMVLFDEFE